MHIFRHIFLSNYSWQKSDISSQASYRYPILWEAFFHPSDSDFLFADLVGFYTHLTYMHIFRRIFLTKYWWQESDIWSQASYTFRYAILWEAVFFVKSAIFDTSKLCKCQHIERVTILKFFDLLYVHKVICTSQYSIVYLLTL